MNLIGVGTCRKNRIGFPGNYERFVFPKSAERVTYRQIYNRRFRLVATRRKDFKTLQFVSSLRETVITEVPRKIGRYIHQVVCTEYLIQYHQTMDGVDLGGQL